jgi:hypothetical protein
MTPGNKELFVVLGAGIAIVLVAAFLEGQQAPVQAAQPGPSAYPGGAAWPFTVVPPSLSGTGPGGSTGSPGTGDPWSWTVPGAPDPSTFPQPAPININVTGQPFGYLAPYFPLFGFVGVDTTQEFQ